MGARKTEEARSFLVSSLRRRLGLVICRESARHRIRRVPCTARARPSAFLNSYAQNASPRQSPDRYIAK